MAYCIKETLHNICALVESALELNLEETTLGEVIDAVKTSGVLCKYKKPFDTFYFCATM